MEINVLILHGILWKIFHRIPWRYFTRDVSVPLLIHVLTFGIVLSSCLLVLFKNNHGTWSIGWFSNVFKHLIIWKFARVHLQNAGWHSIFTLLRSSANVRHDFFILHVCSLRSVLFRADTSSMHCSDEQKFTKSPKISF